MLQFSSIAKGLEIAHQSRTQAGRAAGGVDHQVVDLQVAAAPDFGGDPDAGDCGKLAVIEGAEDPVMRVLSEDGGEALGEDFRRDVGVQLREQGVRGGMIFGGEFADLRRVHAGVLARSAAVGKRSR